MVLYFTSNVVTPSAYIYMGRDKFENEDLIAYGWEEDVWFHVDNLSSAHVYVRLREGETWDRIEEALLIDCAQLTKANSIEGMVSAFTKGDNAHLARQQKGQCNSHLHTMVKSQKGWQHGHGPGVVP